MMANERYFRFDIEPADAYLGIKGDPCSHAGCERAGGYWIALEMEGEHLRRLACAHHVEHVANSIMRTAGASVRVQFEGV
jgi:hypothetical protein